MATKKTSKTTTKASRASSRKNVSAAKTTSRAARKPASPKADEPAATVDRRSGRDRRRTSDRRKKSESVAVERRQVERRAKVNRRRQIDPTTCERDYTPDELEFMNALDEYKRASGRMFPTCSELLEVLKKLGYEKRPHAEAPEQPASGPNVDSNAV